LLACCLLLAVLVLVGGATRLTHSGLSITEWQPILGTLPPLGPDGWAEAFAKYRRTPEYQLINRGMTPAEFRAIYWWEYAHRLLARLLGVAFLAPLLVLLLRRHIGPPLAWRLGGVFLLGAAQGAMGWFMVRSGLVDEPRVSHLRLTAHLGLAFAIFAALFWLALGQLRGAPSLATRARHRGVPSLAVSITGLVFLQVLLGALVAGTHAGLAHATFPLMSGWLIPPGMLALAPWPANLLHNQTTIQFAHRLVAWVLVGLVARLAVRVRRDHATEGTRLLVRAAYLLAAAVAAQFALGVATLLTRVPLALALAHQAGALLLFAAALFTAHATAHRRSIAGP